MIMPKGEIIPTGEAMFRRKRKHSDSFIELPRIGEEGRRKVMKGFLEAVSNPELKKKMISAADADAVAEFENLLREKRLLIVCTHHPGNCTRL